MALEQKTDIQRTIEHNVTNGLTFDEIFPLSWARAEDGKFNCFYDTQAQLQVHLGNMDVRTKGDVELSKLMGNLYKWHRFGGVIDRNEGPGLMRSELRTNVSPEEITTVEGFNQAVEQVEDFIAMPDLIRIYRRPRRATLIRRTLTHTVFPF